MLNNYMTVETVESGEKTIVLEFVKPRREYCSSSILWEAFIVLLRVVNTNRLAQNGLEDVTVAVGAVKIVFSRTCF